MNEEDINNSNSHRNDLLNVQATDPSKGMMKVEEWLTSAARVRHKLGYWETLRFISSRKPIEGTDGNVELPDFNLNAVPVQVPFDALEQTLPDGTKKPIFTWAAIEFAPAINMRRNLASIVISGDAAQQTSQLQTGFVIDEWTEAIPTDEELTAVTFHYNQPNAEAPQAMLLCVCPDTKWTWATVIESVTETFRRAKLRTVDITQLKAEAEKPTATPMLKAIAQMLPMCIAPVNVQQHTFTLDFGIMSTAERNSMTTKTGTALGHYQIWQEG